MVAAKGSAELSVFRFEVGGDEHCSHGESVANALGACDDIWTDVEPLVCEELAATSVAALYLVADKYCSVFLAKSL